MKRGQSCWISVVIAVLGGLLAGGAGASKVAVDVRVEILTRQMINTWPKGAKAAVLKELKPLLAETAKADFDHWSFDGTGTASDYELFFQVSNKTQAKTIELRAELRYLGGPKPVAKASFPAVVWQSSPGIKGFRYPAAPNAAGELAASFKDLLFAKRHPLMLDALKYWVPIGFGARWIRKKMPAQIVLGLTPEVYSTLKTGLFLVGPALPYGPGALESLGANREDDYQPTRKGLVVWPQYRALGQHKEPIAGLLREVGKWKFNAIYLVDPSGWPAAVAGHQVGSL